MAGELQTEIESTGSQLKSLISKVHGNEGARKQLFEVSSDAARQLESPFDMIWRMIMSPHAPAAIMTLLNLGALDRLARAPGAMSAHDLAKATNSDPLLLVRLFRPTTALGAAHEKDEELYEPTETTRALTDPILKGGYTAVLSLVSHSLSQMPDYFKQAGYKNVTGNPGPFQYAKGTSDDMFPWIHKHPDLMSHFNNFMAGQQAQRGDWFNRLSVHWLILDGASNDADTTLLVDIGGGKGHDIQAFHRAYPSAPGKLVLQDLQPVIDSIEFLDAPIMRMPHDFFTPQPVTGARVYYLRSILHDWSSQKCVQILGRVREAMKPGYSKLLLNEFILPAKNVPLYPALLDINMMALLNGMERTKKQWTALLNEAGFKIVNFYDDPTGQNEGIIEAEPK